jgi:ubiquinone/menaquinone biosynthesis C-methylase UbiE
MNSSNKQPSQQEIWDKIAPEWHEFKNKPSENVIEFLKTQKGNILDFGSGSGRHLVKIKEGKMFLVDFSEEMLKLAEKKAKEKKMKAEFKQASLDNIPYEDNFFDSAICVSAIHCLETEKIRKDAIKELFRVLKPKAKAYIGVWNQASKRFKNSPKEKYVGWRDKGKRYYYLYNEDEIHKEFEKAGFKIIKSQNSEMMINFIVQK